MKNTFSVAIVSTVFILFLFPLFGNAQTKQVKTSTKTTTTANKAAAAGLKYGKYGCTASKYRNGSYEYIPRGSFTITANGKYIYNGFKTPGTGTFAVDKAGNLSFKGGYLNGGTAEKIDRPNKFFVVFPTIPDNRWTCGLVEEK